MSHRPIRKVAVLGSGVMGSAIAAHLANAGVSALVLDIVPRALDPREEQAGLTLEDPRVRNRIAATSVQALVKSRPAPLFRPARLSRIEIGNLEDDLHRLADADWVIEVVREDLEIKRSLFQNIVPHLREDAILTSNTSGLPLASMAEVLPAELRPRFLGTHFFNPPRYMRLLELIPTPDTDPAIQEAIGAFCRDHLGKGVVVARDTPNFIANRIGTHSIAAVLAVMQELELTIEEVDLLTGPPLGRPKTGTFRLADLVGIDTLFFVIQHLKRSSADEDCGDLYDPPAWVGKMVEKNLLGRKTGAGFYKKTVGQGGSAILTLDTETLEYREPQKPDFPELKALRSIEDPGERWKALVFGEGRASAAAWKILAATLSYSAMRLEEIADQAATVDRAVELGFNWEAGPFRMWDALGFRETTEKLRADGYPLPAWVDRRYEAGADGIYECREDGLLRSATGTPGAMAEVVADPRAMPLASIRASGGVIDGNRSASLLDLGDGVLCLEFHSKMNAIDNDTVAMMTRAADRAEADARALIVANDGAQFCAGANLQMLLQYSNDENWEAIRGMIRGFQAANDRLERCAVPVVTAPHGMALGGGAEVVLAGNAVRGHAELYAGLVEVGAGLIPAGGGCMRLYRRHVANLDNPDDTYPAIRATFEAIGMAKVSTSAEEARELGFLGPQDGWTMNREHLLADAKSIAIAMADGGFVPPAERSDLTVMGRAGRALLDAGLLNMHEGRFISDHDRKIGGQLAGILSGGAVSGPLQVSERYLLELEEEAFVSLCGEPKSRERILSLLQTGKPLRN